MLRILLVLTGLACAGRAVWAAGDPPFPPPPGATTHVEQTVRQSPRETLRRDLADGHLDQLSLFDAALAANGSMDAGGWEHRRQEFLRSCREIADHLPSQAAAPHRYATLAKSVHARWLTGNYDADCCSLSRTLETGDFNCVTATILFQTVAEFCGERPISIATKSHVLTCLEDHGERWYVETTCADWVPARLVDCPEKTRHSASSGRALSREELLGKVFYNQGVAELRGHRYAAAAESLREARRLDAHDDAARENLLATLNNWALSECDAGHFPEAAAKLAEGLALAPDYGPLQANDLHIHQKWVKQLCARREYARATELLTEAARRRPDCDWFARGLETVQRLREQDTHLPLGGS